MRINRYVNTVFFFRLKWNEFQSLLFEFLLWVLFEINISIPRNRQWREVFLLERGGTWFTNIVFLFFAFHKTDCWILGILLHWRFYLQNCVFWQCDSCETCHKNTRLKIFNWTARSRILQLEISHSSWMEVEKCNYPNFICESIANWKIEWFKLKGKEKSFCLHKMLILISPTKTFCTHRVKSGNFLVHSCWTKRN